MSDLRPSYEELVGEGIEPSVGLLPLGYRSWRLAFGPRGPRLGAVTQGSLWEPEEEIAHDPLSGEEVPVKIVRSDWEPRRGTFKDTSHGLYMLKSLEEVHAHYPIRSGPDGPDIYGAVIPIGRVQPGSIGYRAQAAKVDTLFREPLGCYVCGEPSKYFLHNNRKYPLCEDHFKKTERLVRNRGFSVEEVEEVLERLAEAYQATLADSPWEVARKLGGGG